MTRRRWLISVCRKTCGASRPLVTVGLLILSVFVSGCSNGVRVSSAVRRQLAFQSPVLVAGNDMPSRYKCAEKIWLPLRWGAVPVGTAELVLNINGYGPTQVIGRGGTLTPVIAGALIVGLKPKLHELPVGDLPKGAFGLLEANVPACPPRISGGRFVFRLFALSPKQQIRHPQAIGSGFELLNKLILHASAVGEFDARYS